MELSYGYHAESYDRTGARQGGVGKVLRADVRAQVRGRHGAFCAGQSQRTLALDFDNWDHFEMHHYAFHVSDAEFDAIFGRIKAAGIPYGSGPFSQEDMQINTRRVGRGVYFEDPNGRLLELLTRT
jgi:catechol 2,3-dioxygenase-like lactoylglutathione lyase family enzyme